MLESHYFNTYTSAKYSNDKRTLYLALNRKGISRKVQTKAKAPLGKLETYTNVLTKPVSTERVEALAMKIAKARILLGKFLLGSEEEGLGENHLFRHHRYQFCLKVPLTKLDEKNKFRCRKREKRKKKRKCKDDEYDDDDCQATSKKKIVGKCEEDEDEEECQKRLHSVRQKRKSRNGGDTDSAKCVGGKCADDKEKKRKKRLKAEKKKFSEKTLKTKCDSEINCSKKKGIGKGVRKEKTKASFVEDPAISSLLWKDSIVENRSTEIDRKLSSSSLVDFATEKPIDEYEEEDQTEKFLEEEEDASSEIGLEWATQSSSFSLNRD